jgi:hypothetical protein
MYIYVLLTIPGAAKLFFSRATAVLLVGFRVNFVHVSIVSHRMDFLPIQIK